MGAWNVWKMRKECGSAGARSEEKQSRRITKQNKNLRGRGT